MPTIIEIYLELIRIMTFQSTGQSSGIGRSHCHEYPEEYWLDHAPVAEAEEIGTKSVSRAGVRSPDVRVSDGHLACAR